MPTLSYKYRIEPNRMQAGALSGMLADFCQLYNAALQQRIEAYRRRSISLQYANQALELKAVRCAAPALARWSFSSEQQVLRRLDKTAAMLDYKAASAGVEFVRVDPRGTSQQCPQCGQVAAKALDERRHRCDCGADIDRDVAAAMVVHFRAFGFWPGAGLESLRERVAA